MGIKEMCIISCQCKTNVYEHVELYWHTARNDRCSPGHVEESLGVEAGHFRLQVIQKTGVRLRSDG